MRHYKVGICVVCGEETEIEGKGMCSKCYHKQYRESHKDTTSAYGKQYRENNKDKISNYQKDYQTNNKEKIRERNKSYRQQNKERLQKRDKEYYNNNKQHKSKVSKKHYIENKDVILKKHKEWRETDKGITSSRKHNHKRRMQQQEQFIEFVDLNVLYDKYNGICQCCGIKCDWDDYELVIDSNGQSRKAIHNNYPTHDHIIPLSKGGEESYENAQLLCLSCNSSKNNK